MTALPTEIYASQLDDWLDQLLPSVRVLSLDCFDTIVWRKTGIPGDVFFNLQASSRWQAAGVDAIIRMNAEASLHRCQYLLTGSGEISIEDIYREILPAGTDDKTISAFVDEELLAERDHCFAFEPVLQLIERAHARGLRTIVVSDTYFDQVQLRRLLGQVLGEAAGFIDRIYCSSEMGVSKAGGAFVTVLQQEGLEGGEMAHLGDNPEADLHPPLELGILSAQLRQQCIAMEAQLEQRASAVLQLQPNLQYERGLTVASRALLATNAERLGDPAQVPWRIGYSTLGPVFAAFSEYLQQRLHALRESGKRVRVGFLLRDGYLLARAFETYSGEDSCSQLRISRFTAVAASLQTRDDILWWLNTYIGETSIKLALRPFMLTAEVQERILRCAQESVDPVRSLTEQVLEPEVMQIIFDQSASLRERLLTHVRSATGLQHGETLVLVDVGYKGTVQSRLRKIFWESMGVTLQGMDLVAGRSHVPQPDREGLVGPPSDQRLLITLNRYIGLFEMMCTINEPATVGYTDTGDAIYDTAQVQITQSETVTVIQEACLEYIRDQAALPEQCRPRLTDSERASEVVAEIGRLIYFPSAEEIACLSRFEFDFSLGSNRLITTADLDAGLREFRRKGFMMVGGSFENYRVNYPMEMRYMDVALATTLMSTHRFGVGVNPSTASFRAEPLQLLVADHGGRHEIQTTEAHATHDGYFRLYLPVSASLDMSLLLGQRYRWLQIDCVERVKLTTEQEVIQSLEAGMDFILDDAIMQPGGLVQCGDGAMMLFPRCMPADHGQSMIRFVFRPLVPATKEPLPGQRVDSSGVQAVGRLDQAASATATV